MTRSEIATITGSLSTPTGVTKIRLTGGEPFVRRGGDRARHRTVGRFARTRDQCHGAGQAHGRLREKLPA